MTDVILPVGLLVLALAVFLQQLTLNRHTKALRVITDLILTHANILQTAQNLDVSPVGPPVFCGQKTGERTWCAMDLTDGTCARHGRRA